MGFEKIISMIDELAANLKKEQTDDDATLSAPRIHPKGGIGPDEEFDAKNSTREKIFWIRRTWHCSPLSLVELPTYQFQIIRPCSFLLVGLLARLDCMLCTKAPSSLLVVS